MREGKERGSDGKKREREGGGREGRGGKTSSLQRVNHSNLVLRYKKNLKKLYIVHPSRFIRVMMVLFKPFIR